MIRLENVLMTSSKRLEDVLKTFCRRLEDVLKASWRCFENVLRTSWRRMTKTSILVLIKTSSRRLEDLFWRLMNKGNIFVLMKTSWRRLEDVFWRRRRKRSSGRLQDVFIKTNVCWESSSQESKKCKKLLEFSKISASILSSERQWWGQLRNWVLM